MKVGDRVVFVADWLSFFGMRGRVDAVTPWPMVVLDDDPRPIRVGDHEVAVVDDEKHHGGAE